MCDVISRELIKIDHRNRYMLLIIISLEQLHSSMMYTLIYTTCSYSYSIKMDAYFVCVLSIITMGKNPQKSAYTLHIPTSMIAYIIV